MSDTSTTQQPEPPFDYISFIIDHESGLLSQEETIEGFQKLISTGLIWQLQGCYVRAAIALINAGVCTYQ
jgi:hypothetical protein